MKDSENDIENVIITLIRLKSIQMKKKNSILLRKKADYN